ncbi:MAG: hypothetical protein D6788_01835 [Planctomycetota bacterium]|nr:MAG: hypothetical protein D6788_01835 [Planctomycetota bacterium]
MRRIRLQPDGFDGPIEIAVDVREEEEGSVLDLAWGDVRHRVRVAETGAGSGFLHVDGRVVSFHAVRHHEGVSLWIGGRRYEVAEVRGRGRSKAQPHRQSVCDRITAEMPGTILRVCVQEGETFDPHAPLIVMESMKMEMTLTAPHAGKVSRVCCQVGDLVEPGAVLLELEPLPDPKATQERKD